MLMQSLTSFLNARTFGLSQGVSPLSHSDLDCTSVLFPSRKDGRLPLTWMELQLGMLLVRNVAVGKGEKWLAKGNFSG